MYTPTIIALLGFIGWTLALLILMETIRTKLVMVKDVAANDFDPLNSNLSPFMQRLARAHANCVEGLPLFGGLMLIAIVSGNSVVTDTLAFVFLAARILQSFFHLASGSVFAVTLRFSAFAVQLVIATYWFYSLMILML